MKTLCILTASVAAGWVSLLCAHAGDLTVHLEDPPASGVVVVELYDSAESFSELRMPFRSERFDLSADAPLRLEQVPPQEFALVVYYDLNGNGRLDRNFIGIPTEPMGFSNRYAPKGPPTYERAAFVMLEEDRAFDVSLRRPLGERGRFAAGLGVIARSSPYRDSEEDVFQPIPAIYYLGNRLQIFGPRAQVGLASSENLSLAAGVEYQIGVYEEDDSPILEGLGDRRDTMLAGLSFEAELPWFMELSIGYAHDALDRIGGGMGSVDLNRSFAYGRTRITPEIGVNWLSADMGNDFYGVPGDRATDERAAYRLSDSLSLETGLGFFVEVTPDIQAVLGVSTEWLDTEVTRSPIVADSMVWKGFASIARVF